MRGRELLGVIGILLAAVAAWLAFAGEPELADGAEFEFDFIILAIPARLLPPLVILILIAATACIFVSLFQGRRIDIIDREAVLDAARHWRGALLVYSLAPLAAIAIVAAAAILADVEMPEGSDGRSTALLVILGTGGLIALIAMLAGMAGGRKFGLESHWGGLGGSMGGWSVSAPAVALLVLLACLGGMVAVGTGSSGEKGEVNAINTREQNDSGTSNVSEQEANAGIVQGQNAAGRVVFDASAGRNVSEATRNE